MIYKVYAFQYGVLILLKKLTILTKMLDILGQDAVSGMWKIRSENLEYFWIDMIFRPSKIERMPIFLILFHFLNLNVTKSIFTTLYYYQIMYFVKNC